MLHEDERFVALRARRRLINSFTKLTTLLLETPPLVIDPVALTTQIFEEDVEISLLVGPHRTDGCCL
ncbi:MAG: hypothetical protein P8R42_25660 [Candidatus Binatia bacterium]|nr:hypothetical protein [Candidatus Binatia bacterium]